MPKFRRTHDSNNDEDPLAKVLAPRPDETPKEREIRLAEEAEAQRRSDAIDEELNKQRLAERKAPKCIRILLLGPCPFLPRVQPHSLCSRPKRVRYVTTFHPSRQNFPNAQWSHREINYVEK